MKHVIVISTSLRTQSQSRQLAQQAYDLLKPRDVSAKFIDIRDYALPACDGEKYHEHPEVLRLGAEIEAATHILIAAPIYCYNVSSTCSSVIELTGRKAWQDKVVGVLAAAGGARSYMAPLGFMNGLMLDYRCWVNPRYVYFESGQQVDGEEISQRIEELVLMTIQR